MAALLSGEADALSTGFSEAVAMEKAGKVRMIAVTSPERVDAAPNVPTLIEQGYDVTFVNWRGFFASPDLPSNMRKAYIKVLGEMYSTPEWEKVRARNGWVNIYNPGDKFMGFLAQQEKVIGDLMRELGFL
jgi:putative tricarboxylic transport membrane protein